MKKITQEQIQAVLGELTKLNVPVQSFIGIQDLFNKLPVIEEPKTIPEKK